MTNPKGHEEPGTLIWDCLVYLVFLAGEKARPHS